MGREYDSHYRPEDEAWQSNREHEEGVAKLAEGYCRIPLLKKTARLIGMHHDDGKYTEEWQEYFHACVRDEVFYGEKVDHSTLGGLVIDKYAPDSRFGEMAQIAIYMHHGLADCVSSKDRVSLCERRRQKYTQEEIDRVAETVGKQCPDADTAESCAEAKRDINKMTFRLKALGKNGEGEYLYGHPDFYLGLCERMLLSCLTDADWRDTADFMAGHLTDTGPSDQKVQEIWNTGIRNLERKLAGLEGTGRLDVSRKRISEQCREAAYGKENLYRLAVPTGAGKTLSGLRFALYRARERQARHIFYIAPYKSILEQNAGEIRDAIGVPDAVLEHHGDVVQEGEDALWRYERLIENWDESPVIVTTAVQFFNTLFKEKRNQIRRFHSLCDSVILLDEVQALPVKLIGLFNLAVNFLTREGNASVVLCTATQPLFSEIKENKMLPSKEMTDGLASFEEAFRRVEYHDCTEDMAQGFSAEDAAAFVEDAAEEFNQILVILNTRAAVRAVYDRLQGSVKGPIYHLSTWMCAAHRSDRLEKIRKALSAGEKVICISSQLVEAGVDFSFPCVIRSLAGLDNLIQAAGRCNRNGLQDRGHVFLIRMSQEAERVSALPDIGKAQDAMNRLLRAFRQNPDRFSSRLDSEEAMKAYYKYYFYDRQEEMVYGACVEGIKTNLVELLSRNSEYRDREGKRKMRQAFRSAGEAFSVIDEKGGREVVVPYGDAGQLVERWRRETDWKEKRKLLRALQRYIVILPESLAGKIGSAAVSGAGEGQLLFLDERYYDDDTGIRTDPAEMPFLCS